jgi:hypothetical protein
LPAAIGIVDLTFQCFSGRFAQDCRALFADWQRAGFLLSKRKIVSFRQAVFISEIRDCNCPADAKRCFSDSIIHIELTGIFLIKKQLIMTIANINLLAI